MKLSEVYHLRFLLSITKVCGHFQDAESYQVKLATMPGCSPEGSDLHTHIMATALFNHEWIYQFKFTLARQLLLADDLAVNISTDNKIVLVAGIVDLTEPCHLPQLASRLEFNVLVKLGYTVDSRHAIMKLDSA